MQPAMAYVTPVGGARLSAPSPFCAPCRALRTVGASAKVSVRRARGAALLPPRMSAAEPLTALQTAPAEVREEFGAAVSGEFHGFEADFDPETGAAMAVPNYYVPEEFVEWNLIPVGFQATNSVILRGHKLYQKHFRILHNVTIFGLFCCDTCAEELQHRFSWSWAARRITRSGDHVDAEEELTITDAEEEAGFYAFPDGSFSFGPAEVIVDRTSELQKWPKAELVLRNGAHVARAQVVFDFAKGELVKPVHATVEKFSIKWCDGADLEGASGYIEGWANEAPMEASALDGDWNSGGAPAAPRTQLYLPSGIDVGVRKADDGGCVLQLGWLVEPGRRLVLARTYSSDGKATGSTRVEELRD